MDRTLSEFGSEYEYTYMVYVKSVLMLDNLREVIGDANFCLGLKTYFENNKFKIAKKENFIKLGMIIRVKKNRRIFCRKNKI